MKKKIQTLEQSRNEIMSHCNNLEKSLLLVNQGFEKSTIEDIIGLKKSKGNITVTNMEVEDLVSDEDSISRRMYLSIKTVKIYYIFVTIINLACCI